MTKQKLRQEYFKAKGELRDIMLRETARHGNYPKVPEMWQELYNLWETMNNLCETI